MKEGTAFHALWMIIETEKGIGLKALGVCGEEWHLEDSFIYAREILLEFQPTELQ